MMAKQNIQAAGTGNEFLPKRFAILPARAAGA
jgi:hypothetical protein